MKLYYSKGACSLAVRIIINEIGLKSEYVYVDLEKKQTEKGEDFYKINPKGAVPVLVTDKGDTLTENAVILQYLAQISNSTGLLPGLDDFKRFHVLEWLNFVATEMHKMVGAFFYPAIPQEVKDDVYFPMVKKRLAFLNNHLSNHQLLMGKNFSLPDAYLFVILNWAINVFKFDMKDYAHVQRYFSELLKRKSVMQSLKEEGLM